MDYKKFLNKLPELYEHWGHSSTQPKSNKFQQILAQINGQSTANIMQLLNFAVSCMEVNEVYCQIGCFHSDYLIGALVNNFAKMAYAVDNFSENEILEDSFNQLLQYLTIFSLEDQVCVCDKSAEEFLFELRNLETEEKIGVYFYDGNHDYRSHFMALLLAKPLLADKAIIILTHNSWETVQQATWDFMASYPQCQLLLDLANFDNDQTWNGLQVLSWNAGQTFNNEFDFYQQVKKQLFFQSIAKLPCKEKINFLDNLQKEALNLYSNGNYIDAEKKYKQILNLDRNNSEAWLNIGIFYYLRKQYKDAITTLVKSVELEPSKAPHHYYLGLVFEQIGDTAQAIQAYQQTIALDSTAIQAYNNLGNILSQTGHLDQAEIIYRKATIANPEHFGSYLNLGNVLIERQQVDEAIENYQKALQLKPNDPDILYNLQIAFEAKKQPATAYLYAGYHSYQRRDYQQAIHQFENYKNTQTGDVEFYITLADTYIFLNNTAKAITIYKEALIHHPTEPRLYFLLIQNLQKTGCIDEALTTSNQILKLFPDNLSLRTQNKLILPVLYENLEEIDIYRQRFIESLEELIKQTKLENEEDAKKALAIIEGRTNFYLHYQGQNDLKIQQKYAAFVHKVMADNYPQWVEPKSMPPNSQTGKIRVGYVSALFKYHTVGKLVQGWLKNHSKIDFEIYCYHIGRETDFFTQKFPLYSNQFHHIPEDLEAVCSQIISDNLHILVFTDIGMHPKITQMAGLRLAPIQCTTWGHPITSGSPTIDYYLSSDFMEPENAQKHYSEQLIRLPNIGFSYIKPQIPEPTKTRREFGLRDDAVVYLSCQTTFKYLPQYDYIFAEIAVRVPSAQFVFISYNTLLTQKFLQRIERSFAKVGLNSQHCCTVVPQQSWADYFNLNLVSDIFLDTFSWSGGNTALEAIACNLPVVTCPGEFMRGRHSYAILKTLGVTDTIAQNEAEYIDIAVKLALDLQWRSNITQRMVERHSYLYEDQVCLQALEKFYRQVVQETRAKSSST